MAANGDNYAYAQTTGSSSTGRHNHPSEANAAAGDGNASTNYANTAISLASSGGHSNAAAGNGNGSVNVYNTADAASSQRGNANAEAGNGNDSKNTFDTAVAESEGHHGSATAISTGTENLSYAVAAGSARVSVTTDDVTSTLTSSAHTIGGTAVGVSSEDINTDTGIPGVAAGGSWTVSLNFNGTDNTFSG